MTRAIWAADCQSPRHSPASLSLTLPVSIASSPPPSFAPPRPQSTSPQSPATHTHCAHQGRHSSSAHLDECVQEYICHLFLSFNGRCRQRAVNTVYGLYMLHPQQRGQLRGSEALLTGWSRVIPSVPHPPLTWPLVIAIARTMAGNGFGECAIATLVAFDGLLRVGELVRITAADVSFPCDSRRGRCITCTVPVCLILFSPVSASVEQRLHSHRCCQDRHEPDSRDPQPRHHLTAAAARVDSPSDSSSLSLRPCIPCPGCQPLPRAVADGVRGTRHQLTRLHNLTPCVTAVPHMLTCTWVRPSST